MTHPSSPSGVRFAGGAVTIGLALLCCLTTLLPAPAVAAPTPAPGGRSPSSSPAAAAPSAADDSTPSSSSSSSSSASSPTVRPSAATTSYAQRPDAFSLMLSPTRLVVGAQDAGTTQRMSVINRGQAPVSVVVEKRNFTPARDGSLRYDKDSPYGAADWVRLKPTRFTVAPGSTQVVTADITIPKDSDAGDHEVAVVFLVPSTGGSGNVKVNRGLAAPMYITAPGPVDDTVELSGLQAPRFVTWGPVDLMATLTNRGTVHRDFRGATALRVRAAGKPAAFPDFTIPRGAVRDVSTRWEPPLLCVCHPRVSFVNAEGAAQTLTVRVVVFPWPVALGLLLVALAAVLLVRARRRRSRRHRRGARPTRYAYGSGGDV